MTSDTTTVKLVKRIDWILKMLVGIGILLLAYLFFRRPGLILLFIILGIILLVGFYLPRHIGWKTRTERALQAKKREIEKWGFASRDREGPWINYIDYPLIYKADCAHGKQFYSEWLVIDRGYIIVNPGPSVLDKQTLTLSYDLQRGATYAWDGCTPKRLFYWFALIGTPDWWNKEHTITRLTQDGKITQKTVFWQLAQHASLIHDALYQYLDNIPIDKTEVDELFRQMLVDTGLPVYLARIYWFAVTKFGANDLNTDNRNNIKKYLCESFNHLN